MKSLWVIGLLTGVSISSHVWASDNPRSQADNPSPAWVAAPNASFVVRTVHSLDGHLMIGINNLGQRELTVTVWSADNRELMYLPLDRRLGHVVNLDLHDYPDGSYRVEIANDTEKVVKTLRLATSARLARQAFINVAGTATRM